MIINFPLSHSCTQIDNEITHGCDEGGKIYIYWQFTATTKLVWEKKTCQKISNFSSTRYAPLRKQKQNNEMIRLKRLIVRWQAVCVFVEIFRTMKKRQQEEEEDFLFFFFNFLEENRQFSSSYFIIYCHHARDKIFICW